jgi:microcystin degradation protein MlrC
MRDIFERARQLEQTNDRIIAACPVHGFMHQDVPFAGAGAIVTAFDREPAEQTAEQLSDMLFLHRNKFWNAIPDAAEAVRQARMSDHPPVAIADSGDNIGGGTPGDGTALLREIMKQGVDSALIQICDPESVQEAARAGIGATIRLRVGGKSDNIYGPPVDITGTVRTVFDGRYRNSDSGGYQGGIETDMGLTVRIDSGGITILLTSYPVSPNNIMHVNAAGVFPEEYRITVCKGGLAFRAAYKPPVTNHHIVADTPGYSTANLSLLPYRNLVRPVFPLDTI